MFNRYHNNPEETEATFIKDENGETWFKTGDCAIINSENGQYKILGRLSQDIIKKAGAKISAIELESVLLANEIVSECAIIGVPDEEYGEEIVAYIVLA